MAANLLAAGYDLVVYNRTAAKAEPLVAKGARRADRAGDVAEPGGIVVSMLADDAAVETNQGCVSRATRGQYKTPRSRGDSERQ